MKIYLVTKQTPNEYIIYDVFDNVEQAYEYAYKIYQKDGGVLDFNDFLKYETYTNYIESRKVNKTTHLDNYLNS